MLQYLSRSNELERLTSLDRDHAAGHVLQRSAGLLVRSITIDNRLGCDKGLTSLDRDRAAGWSRVSSDAVEVKSKKI